MLIQVAFVMKFLAKRSLGAGGVGEVYRARDSRLGRELALSVLTADIADHPERLTRIEGEALSVLALNLGLHRIELRHV